MCLFVPRRLRLHTVYPCSASCICSTSRTSDEACALCSNGEDPCCATPSFERLKKRLKKAPTKCRTLQLAGAQIKNHMPLGVALLRDEHYLCREHKSREKPVQMEQNWNFNKSAGSGAVLRGRGAPSQKPEVLTSHPCAVCAGEELNTGPFADANILY